MTAGERIENLDIVRGVAVMGILAMNIVGFALPDAFYLNPMAAGPGTASVSDLALWAFGFVFIDGKMRGLFSVLFGASMLLVIQRAEAKGESPAHVHFRRMGWLLVFGLLHAYLVWYGDILTSYAIVGMVAWLFRKREPHRLVAAALILLFAELALMISLAFLFRDAGAAAAAPHASAQAIADWAEMQEDFAFSDPGAMDRMLSLYRGGYAQILHYRLSEQAAEPLMGLSLFGWETLAYMLIGMAGLKSGFLTGAWSRDAYRKVALIGFGIGVPAYALLAFLLLRSNFDVPVLVAVSLAATVPFRPVMIVATAALILLALRPGGALAARIAAAGRAAFTNYLGTSLVMTTLFYGYGFGQFGRLDRTSLWLVVLAMWALMLAWSKPWLDRHLYGPFEWLWRSLARGRPQPMRRRAATTA